MSYSYYLTCVDCGFSVHLGKTIDVKYASIPGKKNGFAMLGSDPSEGWRPSQKSIEELQQFLFVHRGHEIRVIPETVNTRDSSIEFVFPIDDETNDPLFKRSCFFSSGESKADPNIDADRLPDDVIRRLKNSSHV